MANPGSVNEYFTDSVILNSRNILNIEHYKAPYGNNEKEFSEPEIKHQFTAGEIDLLSRERL